MNPTLRTTDARPEAMADVQGGCDVSLTRGVILYRTTDGGIDDLGIGLVTEGRFAAEATVVDLGSGRSRTLDLSGELVVLDWVYPPTVEHVRSLARDEASELPGYCFDLALRVLRRAGFGPATRSTFLRIGFRDICRDLDFHEAAAVRLAAGPSRHSAEPSRPSAEPAGPSAEPARLYRIHFDSDAVSLVVRTTGTYSDPSLEGALAEFGSSSTLHRVVEQGPGGTTEYHLRLPLPISLAEAKALLESIRSGLVRMIERFEPQRHRTLATMLQTFGARDTLDRLSATARAHATVPVRRSAPPANAARAAGAVAPDAMSGVSRVH